MLDRSRTIHILGGALLGHHEGVTWGHLLANLGFGVGEDYLALDDGPVLTEVRGGSSSAS
jgi:hypothetical protein